MQLGETSSTLYFSNRSDALYLPMCAVLPKVHGCTDLLEATLTPHLLHLHQSYEEVSNQILISWYEYVNVNFHHIDIEIFDSDFQSVDHAA
jgi:hypothetical protein